MKKPIKNLEQSIHQKLLSQAKANRQPFEHLLKRYAMERFLYRLSISSYVNEFVLKGGLLLACYDVPSSRPTLDIDLQAFFSDHHKERVEKIIRQVCEIQAEPDGLRFDPSSLVCEALNHLDGYEGIGAHFLCFLGRADISINIDIGFSASLQPSPIMIDYPTLLPLPKPKLKAYRQESVIAEKFEAMVKYDLATSRMKDFYDIWMLSTTFEFDGHALSTAIGTTFRHCRRTLDADPPVLKSDFAEDLGMAQKWKTFREKNNLLDAPSDFKDVVGQLANFLIPIINGLAGGKPTMARWKPPGPWKKL